MSSKILLLGHYTGSATWKNPSRGCVYDPRGISPALCAGMGGAETSHQQFSSSMRQNNPTGGKRLAALIEKGIPFKGGVWLDTYNSIYNTAVSGTIKARYNTNCMYFVTQVYETP